MFAKHRSLLPMVVTFRSACGAVLDRILVAATYDEQAVELARAIALARSQIHATGRPDLGRPSVRVSLDLMQQRRML